jgi:hypothetical protein
MAEGFGAEEAKGVAETVAHAGEAVSHAVQGEWDKAADSALSMSESALGVATGGISTAVESGLDSLAKDVGLGSTHDAINSGLHAVGDALGDGLSALVGTDQSVQSLHSFDDGDILGGIGHMAEGAADTIGSAVSEGLSDIGDALGLGGGSDSSQPAGDASGGAAPGGSDGSQPTADTTSYDALSSGDDGSGGQISADGS